MRRFTLALILVLVTASMAHAVPMVIDFESFAPTSVPGTHPGTYSGISWGFSNGFTMSLYRYDGSSFDIVNSTGTGFPASWGARSLDPFSQHVGDDFFVLETNWGVTSFSIDFGDYGADDDTPVLLEVYDNGTNLNYLGGDSQSWTSSDAFPDYGTLSYAGAGGRYIAFGTPTSTDFPNSLYFDNMTIEAVPEPGTLALFGFGLASGAAAIRRRRAKKA